MQTFAPEKETVITGKLNQNSESNDNGNYYNIHLFSGSAGQEITIDLISPDFDAILGLVDEQGNLITRNNNGGDGNNARISIALPKTGTFIILAMGEPNGLGEYQLQWRTATNTELKLGAADRLNQQAREWYEQGKYQQAITFAQQALKIREALLPADDPNLGISLNNLGLFYSRQGEYTEAEPLYQRALKIYRQAFVGHHPDLATTLNNLALLYQSQGKYDEAQPLYHEALEMRQALFDGDHPDIADSLNNLAEFFALQGKDQKARSLHQSALAMYRRLFPGEHPRVALSLNNTALFYQSQAQYEEAESLFQEALAMRQRLFSGDHPSVANSLNNLADLYRSQGKYSQAEPLFQDSLEMYQRLFSGDHPLVANSFNNLGELYRLQGRYREAKPFYEKALAMRKRLFPGDHLRVATTLNNLGLLHLSQNEYPLAEKYFQDSLAMHQRLFTGDHVRVALSLNNLAVLYRSQGRYTAAEPLYQEALAMRKRLFPEDHPDVAISLNNLALVHFAQQDYQEAESLFQASLGIYERLFKDAHPQLALSLNNLAALYLVQQDYAQAIHFLKQGTDLEEDLLTRNLVSGSEQQKRAYLKLFEGTTNRAISLHLQNAPQFPEAANLALTTILRRKGRVLDLLGNSLQQLRENPTPEVAALLEKWSAVQNQLSQLAYRSDNRAVIAELKTEATHLEADLMNRSAKFRQQVQQVTIADVQGGIPEQGTLLEFIQYSPYDVKTDRFEAPRYAVYLLSADGETQWADLGSAIALDETIDRFLTVVDEARKIPPALRSQTLAKTYIPAAQALYQQILAPIHAYLKDTKHLLIAPDSNLNLIPFAALVDEEENYLLEEYQMTYLTSGRDLLQFSSHQGEVKPALLLANPTYGKSGAGVSESNHTANERSGDLRNLEFAPLLGTAEEGAAIAQLFPQIQTFTEENATENVLKSADSPQFLHIATHGFFLPSLPQQSPQNATPALETASLSSLENPLLRSGLALAGFNRRESGSEDGVLTALEVSGLNLKNTELVVLSACETAVGRVIAGEGVYGLRRAFTLAGAQAQLMSLWKVADQETKNLMIEYYQRLQQGEGRGEALRQVQLEMLADPATAHPYFWAAFIPIGDWTAMSNHEN
ncbi:MAG: tetratricopeptide repeat protein [Halothece sp. Uz-M2-17]|nr:tetratricopeptide repeat protein [Halothece sp. Uz-M2-17]